jgi:hypothetical protein
LREGLTIKRQQLATECSNKALRAYAILKVLQAAYHRTGSKCGHFGRHFGPFIRPTSANLFFSLDDPIVSFRQPIVLAEFSSDDLIIESIVCFDHLS